MKTSSWVFCFVIPVVVLSLHFHATATAKSDDIPQVSFVVIRLDYLSYTVKGYYQLKQPYRKSLPPDEFRQAGNIFYKQVPASDFGYTRVLSRLTGQLLVHASTVWNGSGRFEYPPDSLFIAAHSHGYINPTPGAFTFVPLFNSSRQQADSAWKKVEDTDIIRWVSEQDTYEVFLFDHFYAIGVADPTTAEWVIVAFTHPRAPLDMGFVNLLWPRTLLTTNVSSASEIIIHNFSDSTINIAATLTVMRGSEPIHTSRRLVASLIADSSRVVVFDALSVRTLEPLVFVIHLSKEDGSPWIDSFPDNDVWLQNIRVTTQSVFRPISSIKYPGKIPVRGIAFDFDDDGDVDVFEYSLTPKLWQNNGHGDYYDITGLSHVAFRAYPRLALAEDLNGDHHKDILIVNFGSSPQFLAGDGTGIFTDRTAETGLAQVTAYWEVEAFDKDNDGDKDLIFQSYQQETLMQNDGVGHFTNVTSASGIVDLSQTEDISTGDLNNDGYEDVVLTNWSTSPTVFLNNGHGTFTLLPGPWNFQYGRMSLLFDFNADGLQDIVFARRLYTERTLLFKNIGNSRFEDVSGQVCLSVPAFHVAAADFNRDGCPDVIAEDLANFNLFLNRGDNCTDSSALLVDMRSHMVLGALGTSPKAQFIDLDGDGDLDIYSQMVVFENMGVDSTTVGVLPTPIQVPSSYKLFQNYPNPFNPSTIIRYQIPIIARVTLKVFDVLGREVATLMDGVEEPGYKSVGFDASDFASGVYIYRLQVGKEFVATKKLVIVR